MLICTPIREKTQANVLKKLKTLKNKVDLAEVWLDQVKDLDLKTLIEASPMPLICVYKRAEEGGNLIGAYKHQAKYLINACKYGAAYIDIPLYMPKNLSKKIVQEKGRTRVIISHHNFEKTVSWNILNKKAEEIKKRGADIVKIATKSRFMEDTFNIILLAKKLKKEKIPHILIAMGPKGMISRTQSKELGNAIMFAPLTKEEATAEGQLTVDELKKAWNLGKK